MLPNEPGDTSVPAALFKHNAWANLKLLDFCERLSDEQLGTTAVGCYGSIRDTLLHIVGAERGYVRHGKGTPREEPLTWDAGMAALKETARRTSEELLKLAISARHDSLIREPQPEGTIEEYPLATLIAQAINHSTEHRAQISAIITQLGMEPPDMSGWQYMWETGEFKLLEPDAEPGRGERG